MEILLSTLVTDLVIPHDELSLGTSFDNAGPTHGVTVSCTTGVDAGSAIERIASRTPVIPDIVCNC